MAFAVPTVVAAASVLAVVVLTRSHGPETAASNDVSVVAVANVRWPSFTAEYREQWFSPEAAESDSGGVTGREEVRRIVYRSQDDWEIVVLAGRTHGGLHADGREEVHALPGTAESFRQGVMTHSEPDEGPYRERAKSSMPNEWLQPSYRDWQLVAEKGMGSAVVRAQRVSAGACPGRACSGAVAWLNGWGIPVRYEEWAGGVLTFEASIEEFSLR